MTKQKLVIYGLGKMAELAHYYFSTDSFYEVVAFTIDKEYKDCDIFCGLPVVEFDRIEELFPPDVCNMYVAIGYNNLNKNREKYYNLAKSRSYILANYISSKAVFAENVKIGDNCFIMEGSIIMPFAEIGNNLTCWVESVCSHHGVIRDHVTISCHVVMGGSVVIESYCMLGLNSTVRDGGIIREGCIIGSCANVVSDTEPYKIYVGNPAKILKSSI